MNLDAILGEGATESFQNAVVIDDTAVVYSNWEYEPPLPVTVIENGLVVTRQQVEEQIWPGPGQWIEATVIWPNINQKIYFQDKKIHWGGGLCQENGGETGDSLKRLASQDMKTFLATYIDEMKVQLPNVPAFYQRFLLAGFEIDSQTDNDIIIAATLKNPASKMTELFNWRIAGAIPEDEPEWRTQLRNDMGLDTLFP